MTKTKSFNPNEHAMLILSKDSFLYGLDLENLFTEPKYKENNIPKDIEHIIIPEVALKKVYQESSVENYNNIQFIKDNLQLFDGNIEDFYNAKCPIYSEKTNLYLSILPIPDKPLSLSSCPFMPDANDINGMTILTARLAKQIYNCQTSSSGISTIALTDTNLPKNVTLLVYNEPSLAVSAKIRGIEVYFYRENNLL